jgi:hypothetical protein
MMFSDCYGMGYNVKQMWSVRMDDDDTKCIAQPNNKHSVQQSLAIYFMYLHFQQKEKDSQFLVQSKLRLHVIQRA